MKTFNSITALILTSFILSNCSSLKTFTRQTQSVNSFTEEELFGIQYFISSPVTLQLHEKRRKSKITDDNDVDSKKVKYRKDIIIDEETPGIAKRMEDNRIIIKISDDISLGFSPDDSSSKGVYKLSSFNGQDIMNKSEVFYRDKKWVIRFGKPGSKFLGLFYDKNNFEEKGVPKLMYNLLIDDEKKYKTVVLKGKELK